MYMSLEDLQPHKEGCSPWKAKMGPSKVLEAGWELVSSRSTSDTILWVSDSTTLSKA